jgi:outer membrane protein OmpA-like peptidoglycan-associated protein
MRSRLYLLAMLAVGACATTAQTEQCFPSASWATPVFKCVGAAAPTPPPPEPKPEPKPEPEPEPPPPPKVEVKAESIELKEKVNFEFASDVLVADSKTLLDEVAKTLVDHPEIKKVRIDGYTDSVASTKYNKKLSDKRAKAVRLYLESKGVKAKRLDSKGWGEAKPIADNKTEEGREKNRRVEIKILERDDAAGGAKEDAKEDKESTDEPTVKDDDATDEPKAEEPKKKKKKGKKKKKAKGDSAF